MPTAKSTKGRKTSTSKGPTFKKVMQKMTDELQRTRAQQKRSQELLEEGEEEEEEQTPPPPPSPIDVPYVHEVDLTVGDSPIMYSKEPGAISSSYDIMKGPPPNQESEPPQLISRRGEGRFDEENDPDPRMSNASPDSIVMLNPFEFATRAFNVPEPSEALPPVAIIAAL